MSLVEKGALDLNSTVASEYTVAAKSNARGRLGPFLFLAPSHFSSQPSSVSGLNFALKVHE
jgi:hypothetical protein